MILYHPIFGAVCALSVLSPRVHVEAQRRIDIERAQASSSNLEERRKLQNHVESSVGFGIRRAEGDDESAARLKPEDHLVESLPLLEDGKFETRHYAGHLSADPSDKKLFYWLFEPDYAIHTKGSDPKTRLVDSDAPLLIWLNGGPGCSSMDGLWLENGPFRLVKPNEENPFAAPSEFVQQEPRVPPSEWRIELNPFSWHKAPAYVLYIDQPVGTGLSFTKTGKYCNNDLEVNRDFYYFLQEFLTMYSEIMLDDSGSETGAVRHMKRPVYFSGESHAGHYIPSMMDYILQQNDAKLTEAEPSGGGEHNVIVQLEGAAIGNGWVDPYYQYSAHKAAYGMALIDEAQFHHLAAEEKKCRDRLTQKDYTSGACFHLLDSVVDASGGRDQFKVSTYDNRMWERTGTPRNFPPGHKDVESYLGNVEGNNMKRAPSPSWAIHSADVLQAIHATQATDAKQYYRECTDPPYDHLAHQDGLGVVSEVVRILEHPGVPGQGNATSKVRLLFFNGVNDLICNHAGNEDFLMNLPWEETDKWIVSPRYVWRSSNKNGVPVGYMKQHANLLFLKVLNAGHMVPMDHPQQSLEMMHTFLYGKSFEDVDQKLDRKADSEGCAACPPRVQCKSNEEEYYEKSDMGTNRHAAPMNFDDETRDRGQDSSPVSTPGSMGTAATTHSVIAFAWVAALFASLALVVYAVRRRRTMSPRPTVVAATDEDDAEEEHEFDYNDNDTGLEIRYRQD